MKSKAPRETTGSMLGVFPYEGGGGGCVSWARDTEGNTVGVYAEQ